MTKLRKSLRTLFALALAVCLLLPAHAQAVSAVTAQMRPDMKIIIDGSRRYFYNVNGRQVHPILYRGTTYLPVRAIGELMGRLVDWNGSTKTVTLGGTRTAPPVTGPVDASAKTQNVSITIRDDFTVIVDGQARTFHTVSGRRVYPILYRGSTYLPVRSIGELMGRTVLWDGATQTVTLQKEEDGDLVTDADSFGGVSGAYITREKAQEIALERVPGAASGHVSKLRADYDDGRPVFEVEILYKDAEYDVEIDAQTGRVIDYSCDYDYDCDYGCHFDHTHHWDGWNSGAISREEAQRIALAKVPGAVSGHISKLKLDEDDGRLVFEVTILYKDAEYEMKIDALTGRVIDYDCDYDYDCNYGCTFDHTHHWDHGWGHHGGTHH